MQPLVRGDIFRAPVTLRSPTGEWVVMHKRVVVLQNEDRLPNGTDFAFVLLSTFRRDAPRAFEVTVDPADHPTLDRVEFDVVSVMDCRWVRTDRKTILAGAELLGRLPSKVMHEVDFALGVGLGMVDDA